MTIHRPRTLQPHGSLVTTPAAASLMSLLGAGMAHEAVTITNVCHAGRQQPAQGVASTKGAA